jgi:hypothetical protein
MEIITYSDLKDKQLFLTFCQEASLETKQPASENMWHPEWQTRTNTLPFQLTNRNRFTPPYGEFHLLLDNNKIVACGGVYRSEFSRDVAIAGCRAWIHKDYRNLSLAREYLLPAQKQWALDNEIKIISLTFNDYNKNIIQIFKKRRLGEHRSPRESHHIFYLNFNEVDFPVNIQYTKQWIIYEILDPLWSYDWRLISYE